MLVAEPPRRDGTQRELVSAAKGLLAGRGVAGADRGAGRVSDTADDHGPTPRSCRRLTPVRHAWGSQSQFGRRTSYVTCCSVGSSHASDPHDAFCPSGPGGGLRRAFRPARTGARTDVAVGHAGAPSRPTGAPAAPMTAPPVPAAGGPVMAPTAPPGVSGRRSDVFDPAQSPNAPGAPRVLGSLPGGGAPVADAGGYPANGDATGAAGNPPGGPVGAPLDLGTMSAGPRNDAPPGQAAQPRYPAGQQVATLPPAQTPRDEFDLAYGYVLRKDYAAAADRK